MNSKTLQHMQYFVGKVCSIVTSSMNRSFDEKTAREHFAIRVGEITVDGIWGTHPYNEEMVSFFSLTHVISIHQEVELDQNNPEHMEMIKEYESKTGKTIKGDLKTPSKPKKATAVLPILDQSPPMMDNSNGDSAFIDIESLDRLAENTKRAFTEYDNFDLRKK